MNTPKDQFKNRFNNNSEAQKKSLIVNKLKNGLNIAIEKIKQIEFPGSLFDYFMIAACILVLVLSIAIEDEETTTKEKIHAPISVELEDVCNTSFILTKNEDGTETAEYIKNPETEKLYVTFKNDGLGNITYISGKEILLPLISMNYLYYRGYNPAGSYNSTTHIFKNKKPIESKGNRYWEHAHI